MGRLEDLKLKIEEARAGRMEKVGATTVPPQKPAIYSQAVAGPEVYVPIGLRAIGLNESDGGKYLDHPLVKTGQMAGERAGGIYGMMPLTFRDVVNSDATLKSEYGAIAALSTDEITKALNEDTQMAKATAVKYYEHLSADFHNDHIRVAYAWNHGPGCVKGRPDSVLLKDSYVQDYMRHYVKELAKDKTLWHKELEPKLEDLQFKPAVVTGNGEMALTKAEEKKWPTEPAQPLKWHFNGFDGEISDPVKHGSEKLERRYHAGHSSKWHRTIEARVYSKHPPNGSYYGHTISSHATADQAKHSAERHHIRSHYGLSDHEVNAVTRAFPDKGIHRFVGVHPDMVRGEVDRAVKAHPDFEKSSRDEAIGERDWSKIKGPAESLKFEHPVNGETGKPIEGAFTRANTEHGQYRKWNSGNLYYERKPRDEHDHPWNQHLSDSSDPERLTQAAHEHHVMRHYNLNVNDRMALKHAFPNRSLHEYIGVHPDTVRSELDRAHKSYNMNKALAKAELQKMAIKDLRAGEKKSSTEYYDIHDYDHLLKPEHVKAGYGLTVWQQRKGVRSSGAPDVKAVVTHKGMPVGRVIGHVHDTGVGYPGKYHSLTPHSEIDKEHRGKGLGLASYEALYAHAKHKMGVTQIDGGEHTNDAGRVHEALASKHGLSYKSKPQFNEAKPGGLDTDRAPYRYALKSEEPTIQKMAIQDIKPAEHKLGGEYDYSHVLTPEHRNAGYVLGVREMKPVGSFSHEVQVHLRHNGESAGGIQAYSKNDQAIHPGTVSLYHEHRGKKLGVAMYEALYAHAKHKLGMTHAEGGGHSPSAVRVHQSLARKHGLEYKHEPPAYSEERGSPYKYALKSEAVEPDLIKRKKEAVPNELPSGHKLLGSDRDQSVYTKPHEMTGRSPNPHSLNISEGLKNPKGIKSMGHFSRGTLRAEHPRYGHVRMKPDSSFTGIESQAKNEVRAHDTMHLLGLGKHMHHVGLVHTKVADHLVGDTYDSHTFSIHHELKDHSTLGQYHNSTRKNKKLPSTNDVLKHHAKSGDLHKLGVADYILGNTDRHAHNVMVHSSKPKEHPLQMIDHGLTLYGNTEIEQDKKDNSLYYPTYLRNLPNHSGAAHEKVKSWVNSIDANKIHKHLKASGLRSNYADAVKTRISHVKHAFKVNNDSTEALRDIWGDTAHFKQKRNPQTYDTFGQTNKPHFNTAKEVVSGNAPTS